MWLSEHEAWVEDNKYSLFAFSETFWYVAPTMTIPNSLNYKQLQWAMTLHAARLNHGRAPAHLGTLKSIQTSLGEPDVALKAEGTSFKAEAENFLESVRKEVNPNAPSRLACYYVSMDSETAKLRKAEMRGERAIFPCRILLDGAVHCADITLYDEIVNSLGYPRAQTLGEQYWDRNNSPQNIPVNNLEILVGGSLYFPDWSSFPKLDLNIVAEFESIRNTCLQNGWPLTGWQRPPLNTTNKTVSAPRSTPD